MSKTPGLPRTLAGKRQLLLDKASLPAISMDDLLELANSVTEELNELALEAVKEKAFKEAADIYFELAAVWLNANEALPDDMDPHLRMLARYWTERAEEGLKQAKAADEKAAVSAEATEAQPRPSSGVWIKPALEPPRPISGLQRRDVSAFRNSALDKRSKKPSFLQGKDRLERWKK